MVRRQTIQHSSKWRIRPNTMAAMIPMFPNIE